MTRYVAQPGGWCYQVSSQWVQKSALGSATASPKQTSSLVLRWPPYVAPSAAPERLVVCSDLIRQQDRRRLSSRQDRVQRSRVVEPWGDLGKDDADRAHIATRHLTARGDQRVEVLVVEHGLDELVGEVAIQQQAYCLGRVFVCGIG